MKLAITFILSCLVLAACVADTPNNNEQTPSTQANIQHHMGPEGYVYLRPDCVFTGTEIKTDSIRIFSFCDGNKEFIDVTGRRNIAFRTVEQSNPMTFALEELDQPAIALAHNYLAKH